MKKGMHYDWALGKKVSDVKLNIAKPNLYFPNGRRRKRKNKRTSIPLPDNWLELQGEIRIRDRVCQDCGGIGGGVHHVDFDRTHNEIENLIYLCWGCHKKRHWKEGIKLPLEGMV